MNREERLKALNEIEGQLSQYLAADKKNWIHTYLLMSEVQDKELYAAQYRSYTYSLLTGCLSKMSQIQYGKK